MYVYRKFSQRHYTYTGVYMYIINLCLLNTAAVLANDARYTLYIWLFVAPAICATHTHSLTHSLDCFHSDECERFIFHRCHEPFRNVIDSLLLFWLKPIKFFKPISSRGLDGTITFNTAFRSIDSLFIYLPS